MAFEGVFRRPMGYFQLIIGLLCIIQNNGAVDLGKSIHDLLILIFIDFIRNKI